tara:strand:+ start:84134 stop:84742 length:609 start_codon:yes stop_codon:yes gene_type:complete
MGAHAFWGWWGVARRHRKLVFQDFSPISKETAHTLLPNKKPETPPMRHSLLVAATFMLATTSSSWAQDATEGVPNIKQPDQENVQAQHRDTMEDIRQYSAEQKEQAMQAARNGLDRLDARIDDASDSINDGWKELSQETRLKKQQALANLKEQRAELQADYQRLQDASADNWDAAKVRFGNAWDATRQAWRELTAPTPAQDQ